MPEHDTNTAKTTTTHAACGCVRRTSHHTVHTLDLHSTRYVGLSIQNTTQQEVTVDSLTNRNTRPSLRCRPKMGRLFGTETEGHADAHRSSLITTHKHPIRCCRPTHHTDRTYAHHTAHKMLHIP